MKTDIGTEIIFYELGSGELSRMQQEWMVPSNILVPSWELSEEKAIKLASNAESMFKSVSKRPCSIVMFYKNQGSKNNDPPLWEDMRTVCVISDEQVEDGELAAVYFDAPKYRKKNSDKDMPELVTWHFCKNPKIEMTKLQEAEARADAAEARIKELEAQLSTNKIYTEAGERVFQEISQMQEHDED